MTKTVLENEGVLHDADVDETGTWTRRLGSEQLSKYLWHQAYFVTFKLKSGNSVSAIAEIKYSTISDMNMGPIVYVVSKVLQPEGKPEPAKK